MSADALLESLPDLVIALRRDGTLVAHSGGQGVPALRPPAEALGKSLESFWPESVATLVRQLARKAIASRVPVETQLSDRGRDYEARATAQGPDKALVVIRALLPETRAGSIDATGEHRQSQLDRRGFLRRFKESLSVAALREKPLAVAVIHVGGLSGVAQVIAPRVSDQIMSAALQRLPAQMGHAQGSPVTWYLGQLSEALLAIVFETADRDAIEACTSEICRSLREPVSVGDAGFHLTPAAGVAILGPDASTPKLLLEHARFAANEARRSGSSQVQFFTDTLSLRALARLDIARELREAIDNREIGLRYAGRHDLATGRLVAWVGYLRWSHPLRKEVRPVDFLRVAESTGLATALSRAILARVQEDFATLSAQSGPDVRISFGPLRHHILNEDFVGDIQRLLAGGALPAERVELRISEKTLTAREAGDFKVLQRLGVRVVVDEVGRGLGSLNWLARAPLWGLQLDRAWTAAVQTDAIAMKVCRAGVAVAEALGLTPIATGVDDESQREALVKVGCPYGSGDLFASSARDIIRKTI